MRIFTVGDGDLSFGLSIISWLNYKYPKNVKIKDTFLMATTYDSLDHLELMYKHFFTNNLKALKKLKNVQILH